MLRVRIGDKIRALKDQANGADVKKGDILKVTKLNEFQEGEFTAEDFVGEDWYFTHEHFGKEIELVKRKHRVPKLKIVNRNPGSISHGANTLVYLDDKLLGSAFSVKVEFQAKKITKATIEMYIDPEIELDSSLRLASKSKPKSGYVLGKFESKGSK